MNYYVLLVESGREDIIKKSIEVFLDENETVLFPTRDLYITKKGKKTLQTKPLFSGYLFLYKDAISGEFLKQVKQINGFFKFLNANRDIVPLQKREIEQLGNFLKKNYRATVSSVVFNKSDRIVVKEGPLKEFEGQIIKVDKRKQRAKVQLSMYNESHTIDFSFIDLDKT